MAGPAKPIHPATIHFPIAFLTLAFGLDILTHNAAYVPSNLLANLPPQADLTKAAYYLLGLGLVTSVPAVLTGGVEAIKLFGKGMYETDGKTVRTKVKATIVHAVANDIVIAIATYIFLQRRKAVQESVAGKLGAATAYAPEAWHVGAEAAIMLLFFFAANVGGSLTYNYGVGFKALGTSGKKTQ